MFVMLRKLFCILLCFMFLAICAYSVQKSKAKATEPMALADKDGRTTTLDSLLARNRGKVVYIDFWASVCAPCRRVIPLSQKMREHYSDKDVVFVYIAVYDKVERWKAAAEDEGLNDGNCHSYIVTNPDRASIGKHRVGALPRFMLFDKQGKLVDSWAPYPMSKEIIAAIDKLLK